MDKISPKSNEESCISTTGTPDSHHSDTLDNNLKYINLNFVENSETSSQQKEIFLEYQKFQNAIHDQSKAQKPLPNKIVPTTLPMNGVDKQKSEQQLITLQEKSLLEMGYKPNEVEGWENIVQPPKEDLYKLLKNMIDNHIKPSVQIRIGEVTFNCHMMVLQCYSDFFMECNSEILIQLPEEKITPAAFMMVYDWMLSPHPLVQREGILELFNAANFLRIKDLINQCWLCLDDDERFREDTAFLLYMEARKYGLENLEQLMLMRICKFFLTLVASKEFLTLNAKEICTLLSSNTIGVNSEIEIFMSVVRWLSHNWSEREPHMLDVVKCVRFSLMPPWFLVTLNKNTDCLEIDRIIEHPEVKKMINDGITYTTTRLYYGENRDEFLHFLERYQLIAPMQRQWVFDKECNYHHRLECPNMQYVTYKSFLEYLQMIRTIGKDYWHSLEMDKGVQKSMHCFLCSDCRKTTEPNLATILTKRSSRDQGIQCASGLKSHKDTKKSHSIHTNVSGKKSVRRTARGQPRCAPSSAASQINILNNETTTEAETIVDFKYSPETNVELNFYNVEKQQQHQPESVVCDDNNHQEQQRERQQEQTDVTEQQHIVIDSHPLQHTFPNNILHGIKKQQQLLSEPYQMKQQHQRKKKLQDNKTQNDSCCTVIYKRDGGLMAHVSGDIFEGQQQTEQQHQQTECIISDNYDVESIIHNTIGSVVERTVGNCNVNEDLVELKTEPTTRSCTFVDDLKRILNHKILVFGGIDPYCLNCQHVQQHQQLQRQQSQKLQQHENQYQYSHQRQQQELLQRKRVLSIDSIIMNTTKTTTTISHPSRIHQMQTCAYTSNAVANKNIKNFGDHVLYYDMEGKEWRHLSHIPFGSRHHHAVVVCNGLIYVIGGTRTSLSCSNKSIFEKSIWCFNPQTLKWTLETNLPESRRDFAVIAIDKENQPCHKDHKNEMGFYVIGGEGVNSSALNTVWFYNVERKNWIKKPSLNVGRYGLAAAMVNKEIWVAGGICGNNNNNDKPKAATTHVISDTIEIYNLKCVHCDVLNSEYKGGTDIGKRDAGTEENDGCDDNTYNYDNIVDLKNRLGDVAINSNCNVGQWIKSKLHLRIPRLFGKFCKMSNRQLYLVGGIGYDSKLDEFTSLTDIDVFNGEQYKWEHVGDLNLGRHGHDVATLNDHCCVVIGGVSTFEKCTLSKVETFCTKTRKTLKDLPDLPWPVSGCAAVTIN